MAWARACMLARPLPCVDGGRCHRQARRHRPLHAPAPGARAGRCRARRAPTGCACACKTALVNASCSTRWIAARWSASGLDGRQLVHLPVDGDARPPAGAAAGGSAAASTMVRSPCVGLPGVHAMHQLVQRGAQLMAQRLARRRVTVQQIEQALVTPTPSWMSPTGAGAPAARLVGNIWRSSACRLERIRLRAGAYVLSVVSSETSFRPPRAKRLHQRRFISSANSSNP